ncbi:MAG: hypothetical protein PHI74_07820 [Methanocellales archaeon]|nr:hypothetical protein [Methanocellales archaeon]MDD5485916.1 hypothetical protein [Methanocellales archaeon]
MKRNRGKYLAMLLCIALVSSMMPVQAYTTEVTVTKYAANNYSTVMNTTTRNYAWMRDNLPVMDEDNLYTTNYTHHYFQGPTFDPVNPWDPPEEVNVESRDYGAVAGTDVKDLCELVGGMETGDEIQVRASDSFNKWFNYAVAYNDHGNETLDSKQGPMVLAWYNGNESITGEHQGVGYPDTGYSVGMRLHFFADNSTNPDHYHAFGLWDMHECIDEEYWHYYLDGTPENGTYWPSSSGLSVKYINQLNIYPPHLHDFNDTGDTVGWAFGKQVSSTKPSTNNVPSTEFNSTAYANIADDDGVFQNDTATSGYAAHRFNFSINTSTNSDGPIANIEKLTITWNGRGWHDNPNVNYQGAYLYIWNGASYEELDNSYQDSNEVTLTGEITSDISSYINSGNVTVLVRQEDKTFYSLYYSHIQTDYVSLEVAHHH